MEVLLGLGPVGRIATLVFVVASLAFAVCVPVVPFLYMVGVVSGVIAVTVARVPSSPASIAAVESSPATAEGLVGRCTDDGDRDAFESELDSFVSLIVRDYIESWYRKFAGEDDLQELKTLVGVCFENLARRVLRLDAEKLVCAVFERYRTQLASRRCDDSRDRHLHDALERPPASELQHNKASAVALIQAVTPVVHSSNALVCELLSEVLSFRVITPLVDLLSEPKFVLRVVRLLCSPDAGDNPPRPATAHSGGFPSVSPRCASAVQLRSVSSSRDCRPQSAPPPPPADCPTAIGELRHSRDRQSLSVVAERRKTHARGSAFKLLIPEVQDAQNQPDEFVSDELAKYFVVAPEPFTEPCPAGEDPDGIAADVAVCHLGRAISPVAGSRPSDRSPSKLAAARDSPELFTDVLVTSAQASDDGSTVTYTITYKAWYRRIDGSASALRSRTIRKDHQQIVNLHNMLRNCARLQENMAVIGSPTCLRDDARIASEPESLSMLKATVASYLQRVTSDSLLCESEEVRQFLDCSDDCFAVPLRPADVGIPRLNKVFVRTVSGVWDRMTGFSFDSKSRTDKQTEEADRLFDELKSRIVVRDSAEDEDNRSYKTINLLRAYIEKAFDGENVASQSKPGQTDSNVSASQNIRTEQERDAGTTNTKGVQRPGALARAVAEAGLLIVQSCGTPCWLLNAHVAGFLVNTVAPRLDQRVKESLRHYLAMPQLTHYLHLLRDLVDASHTELTDDDDAANLPWSSTYEKTVEALKSALPGYLPVVVGTVTFDRCLRTLLDSFDDKVLNKHLLYCILDDLIAELLSVIDDGGKETAS